MFPALVNKKGQAESTWHKPHGNMAAWQLQPLFESPQSSTYYNSMNRLIELQQPKTFEHKRYFE